jgi:hypothetical protein
MMLVCRPIEIQMRFSSRGRKRHMIGSRFSRDRARLTRKSERKNAMRGSKYAIDSCRVKRPLHRRVADESPRRSASSLIAAPRRRASIAPRAWTRVNPHWTLDVGHCSPLRDRRAPSRRTRTAERQGEKPRASRASTCRGRDSSRFLLRRDRAG